MIRHQFTEFDAKPCTVAVFDAVNLVPLLCQLFCDLIALLTGITDQIYWTVLTDLIHMFFKFFPVNIDGTRISLLVKIRSVTDINDLFFSCIFL